MIRMIARAKRFCRYTALSEPHVRERRIQATHVYFVLLINIVEFARAARGIDLQLAPMISAMRIADATMRERANHRRFLVSLLCLRTNRELFAPRADSLAISAV